MAGIGADLAAGASSSRTDRGSSTGNIAAATMSPPLSSPTPTPTPTPTPASTQPSSGLSVLSDKVSRALEVRTDTPAMRAALDALANLPPDGPDAAGGSLPSGSSGSGLMTATATASGGMIDARSVRVAIEKDALRQALLFEEELRSLVKTVSELRAGVSAVTKAAARVARSVEASVVVVSGGGIGTGIGGHKGEGDGDGDDDDDEGKNNDYGDDGEDYHSACAAVSHSSPGAPGLEEERRLAALLSDAFRKRDEAARRAEAVSAFLDRFDLSDDDARLLDRYAFEEFDDSSLSTTAAAARHGRERQGNADTDGGDRSPAGGDGMAFLDALERIRSIREELGKTFNDDGSLLETTKKSGRGGGRKGRKTKTRTKKSEALMTSSDERLGAASAVRMMESLASRQERAYTRLYHFLQSYLDLDQPAPHVPTSSAALSSRPSLQRTRGRFGDDDDAADEALFAHPFVRRSLYVLRRVPAYRAHMLELVASARRGEVTRRFLLALTSGYGGAPPIEMRAHDPVGYVGDMLAFAFRAFSVEAELARGLVDYDPQEEWDNEDSSENKARKEKEEHHGKEDADVGGDDDNDDDDDDDNDDPLGSVVRPMTSSAVLSHAVSGLARPLRSRISQVVSSLARRPDEDDDDHHERHRRMAGAGHGTGGGGGVAIGDDDDLDEESEAALHRLEELYSICGLLLFYRSAFEKGVWKLEAGRSGAATENARRRKKKKKTSLPKGVASFGNVDAERDEEEEGEGEEEENPLVECTRRCLIEAAAAYATTLRVYAVSMEAPSSLSSGIGVVVGATAAAAPLSELARVAISRICDVRSSSPGFATDVGALPYARLDGKRFGRSAKEEADALRAALSSLELDFLCDALLGPALAGGRCRVLDDAVSLKAALAAAKRAGLCASAHARWDRSISEREKELADELIQTETRRVLRVCGLGSVLDAIRLMESVYVEGQVISGHPGLGRGEVEAAVKEFYASLYAPPLPSFEGTIKDAALRRYARSRTAEGVADAYAAVYEAVTGENGGYDDLSFLGHDPAQVRTLLSL